MTLIPDTMARLRRTFASGRTRDRHWRLEQLTALVRFVEEKESEIADAIGRDLGRSPFDSWFGEIAGMKAEAAHARKHLARWMRKQRVPLPLTQRPGSAWVQYEPLGVALVIGPWNYPVSLTLGPLVAAIAAGNCVVIKPSELAPATSTLLAAELPNYLDPDAIAIVEGDAAVTQELLAQGFDHALFTGGTEVGRKIMAGAAATLTPVTLELGGKSPVVVAADADVEVAARRIAWVKIINSGQTCIAPDYVLAHESIAEELVRQVGECFDSMGGHAAGVGQRIVDERQFARLRGYLSSTQGTIVKGGATDADGWQVAPTIVVDPSPDEPLMTEEIFGPILPVVTFRELDEAIAFVNGRSKPLALYVFSQSRRVQRHLLDAIPSGGAVINHIALHFMVPDLPFGGVGASGMGAYHGRWGFETFSHRRAVLAKRARPDLRMVYPPYTARTERLMRRLF